MPIALLLDQGVPRDAAGRLRDLGCECVHVGDPLGRIVPDPRHSSDEERFVLLGVSRGQHLLAVMLVDCGEAIRIISARPATRHERKAYEENTN